MPELRRDKRLLVIGEPDFKSPYLIGKCFEREGCCYARHPSLYFRITNARIVTQPYMCGIFRAFWKSESILSFLSMLS